MILQFLCNDCLKPFKMNDRLCIKCPDCKDQNVEQIDLEEYLVRANTDLQTKLDSAVVVMKYYDKNSCIHPMLEDFATQWLDVNGYK